MKAFSAFDVNDSGFITADDLIRMMRSVGEIISVEEARDMIREGDKDNDGKISFDEFRYIINDCPIGE